MKWNNWLLYERKAVEIRLLFLLCAGVCNVCSCYAERTPRGEQGEKSFLLACYHLAGEADREV